MAPERRSSQRFPLDPEFPLTAVFSFVGRDEKGELMGRKSEGWAWKGRLIDISEYGARMQLGPDARARDGDSGELRLSIGDSRLVMPCHITNHRESDEGTVYGLKLNDTWGPTHAAYRQLIEVVALGRTLRPQGHKGSPDGSGYLVEQYLSPRPARLTLWRYIGKELAPAAFEFILKGCIVRAAKGQAAEYLTYSAEQEPRSAATNRALEIHRLFQWVVPNLSSLVPDDVRRFLKRYV